MLLCSHSMSQVKSQRNHDILGEENRAWLPDVLQEEERVAKKFFASLALHDLINEVSEKTVRSGTEDVW